MLKVPNNKAKTLRMDTSKEGIFGEKRKKEK